MTLSFILMLSAKFDFLGLTVFLLVRNQILNQIKFPVHLSKWLSKNIRHMCASVKSQKKKVVYISASNKKQCIAY